MRNKGFSGFIAIIIAAIVLIGLGYYVFLKRAETPAENNGLSGAPYASEEECIAETSGACNFVVCDYITGEQIIEEVCGEDFKGKGWYPVR